MRVPEEAKARLLEVQVKIVQRAWKCSLCGALLPIKNHKNRKGTKPVRCWNRAECGRIFYERSTA